MRGRILGVDPNSGEGQISGDDGRRYRFRPEDWSDRIGPAVGAHVDFDTNDGRAIGVYRAPGTVPVVSPAGRGPRPGRPRAERSKIVAALLAFFFGMLGIHRFYLGRTASGVTMLLLTCIVIGIPFTWVWSVVDTIRLLMMTNADFADRYEVDPA